MKYCTNCGNQLSDEAEFCTKCGNSSGPMWEDQVYPPVKRMSPKKKVWIGLAIGIPVVALIAVAVVLLTSVSPMVQFGRGMTAFFDDFTDIPGIDLADRMEREPYDMTMDVDLSGLGPLIPAMAGGSDMEIGYKKNVDENAFRLGLSMSGLDLADLSGFTVDNRLYLGFCAPMLLGTKEIQSFYVDIEETEEPAYEVQGKLLSYMLESLDPDCFVVEKVTINNVLSGDEIDTKAISLMMGSEDMIVFIEKLQEKMDADPAFYEELSAMMRNSSYMGDSQDVDDMMEELTEALEGEKFYLKVTLHMKGATPLAIVFSMGIPEENGLEMSGSLTKILEKGEKAVWFDFMMDDDHSSIDGIMTLNIARTDDGYACDTFFSMDTDGQEMITCSLYGNTKVDSLYSDEYDIYTDCTLHWDMPALSAIGDLGTGDIDLSIDQNIRFGDKVTSLQEDDDFMYDDVINNAKPMDSMEEIGTLFPTDGIQ